MQALSKMVENLNTKLPCTNGLVRYYDVDEDNATNDIVLLMEYINIMNLRKFIEVFGKLNSDNVRFIVYKILCLLKDLMKLSYYHGRLNINNIHIDSQFNVKLTDYSFMSIIDQEAQFTPEEGSRLDIFCLGICILKMLGKINIDQGSDHNIDSYLENMETLKKSYYSVS